MGHTNNSSGEKKPEYDENDMNDRDDKNEKDVMTFGSPNKDKIKKKKSVKIAEDKNVFDDVKDNFKSMKTTKVDRGGSREMSRSLSRKRT